MNTNIKSLPAGNYFTECGYTDRYAWVEIGRTPKTVTLAKVEVQKDPDWKPEMQAGGFAAHCTNQHDQTWLFDKVNHDRVTKIQMTKKGWARKGVRFLEGVAREFYDYNF